MKNKLPIGIAVCFIAVILSVFHVLPSYTQANTDNHNRNLLIVVDGLHPEYITPDLMPNLHALGERGVFGDRHSAAFPTVTRVNSPSISTGSYPARHGFTHNTMWHSEMGDEPFSTVSADNLRKLREISDGKLLTSVSVGEIMEQEGRVFFACGSGGAGNTMLQNPYGSGKGIWTAGSRGFFLPESNKQLAVEAIGEVPDNRPDATIWAFDAYLYNALGNEPPDFTMMWINEPDAAGHAYGVGSPEVIEAIANVDHQIGRVLNAHEENGLTDKVNIFVTTDHGFTTNTGNFSVSRILEEEGLMDDRIQVVSNMIYYKNDIDIEHAGKVVEALQRNDEVGAIYTRPARQGASEGSIPGTISTGVVQWDHERSADILVSPAWNDDVNEFGYAGSTTRSGTNTHATHGSDSPYDVRIRLVADGPDIKNNLRSNVPSGNVDFIPTILHLQGIQPPKNMDGRILHELLNGGPEPSSVLFHEHTHEVSVAFEDRFRYKTQLKTFQVNSTFYLKKASTYRNVDD